MIRYADKNDFVILRKWDKHITEAELMNAIYQKRVIILFDHDHIVGWLRFHLFWDHIPFINMLYILPYDIRKGYGKKLIDFWEKEMLKKEYTMVLTSTLSTEQAQFFYRKSGYVDCGSLLLPNEPLEIFLLKDFRR